MLKFHIESFSVCTILYGFGQYLTLLLLELEVQRAKEKFLDNSGHNILELYNVTVLVRFIKSKMKLDI